MELLKGNMLESFLSESIYPPKQQGEYSFDLTIKTIYQMTQGGALDFGGSEYEEAVSSELKPVKADPEDKYGWWELRKDEGPYIVTFNERLQKAGHAATFVFPDQRLLRSGGGFSPQIVEDGEITVLVVVNTPTLRIKENARVGKLVAIK